MRGRPLASSRPAQALRARLPGGLRPGSGGTRDSLERHRLIWPYGAPGSLCRAPFGHESARRDGVLAQEIVHFCTKG